MRFTRRLVVVAAALLSFPALADTYSGQRAFGQSTIEPAFDLATGDYVFLLTPDHAPLPSKANSHAVAPLYIVAYPPGWPDPSELNCTPGNCDHVTTLPPLPPALQPVYPGGQLAGHDHLVGVPPTGDFNVAWHVYLLLFTQKAVEDGAVTRLTTEAQVEQAFAAGYLYGSASEPYGVPTPIIFNCNIVSETVYTHVAGR